MINYKKKYFKYKLKYLNLNQNLIGGTMTSNNNNKNSNFDILSYTLNNSDLLENIYDNMYNCKTFINLCNAKRCDYLQYKYAYNKFFNKLLKIPHHTDHQKIFYTFFDGCEIINTSNNQDLLYLLNFDVYFLTKKLKQYDHKVEEPMPEDYTIYKCSIIDINNNNNNPIISFINHRDSLNKRIKKKTNVNYLYCIISEDDIKLYKDWKETQSWNEYSTEHTANFLESNKKKIKDVEQQRIFTNSIPIFGYFSNRIPIQIEINPFILQIKNFHF